MLTIFSIPKPFEGHAGVIQRNAIRSWTRLPNTTIFLFGDDAGVAEAAQQLGVMHHPKIARNEFGTPLMNSIFSTAREISHTELLCYANCDILLPDDFVDVTARLAERFQQFLLTGWCLDIDVSVELEATENAYLLDRVDRAGMDYFGFPRSVEWRLPPLPVGRPGWDHWMMYDARRRRIPVVDATETLCVLHQHHDYAHIPERTGETWEGPETLENCRTLGPIGGFTIKDATYRLKRGALTRSPAASGMGRFHGRMKLFYVTPAGSRVNDARSLLWRLRSKAAIRTRMRRRYQNRRLS